jgi:CubicO group peptidase (beta-lactamase class C family)
VTKPFVAAAALAMSERGLFGLDDRVRDYLPWFQPRTSSGGEAFITIRHLITHTSGLTYDASLETLPDDRAVSQGLGPTDLSLEANFSRLNAVPLAFEPGTGWAYSTAIDILGGVLAAVDGGSLQDAVARYVGAPLGILDARFDVSDPARLAVAYADSSSGPQRMPDPWVAEGSDGWQAIFSPGRIFNPKAFQSGGAGMAGTAKEVLTLLETVRTGGGALFSADLANAALSNQIGDLEANPGYRFGFLGAIVADPVAAQTALPIGAIQWGGVYGNTWFIDPARRLTVVSLTNNALEGCMGAYPEMLRSAVTG